VFVPIDVQALFCDPINRGNTATAHTAAQIAKLAPQFNAITRQTAWVYSDERLNGTADTAKGGFFAVQPAANDILIRKDCNSAFRKAAAPLGTPSDFAHYVSKTSPSALMISGFNLNACVEDTVFDALVAGHNVILLADLCANDKMNFGDIEDLLHRHRLQYGEYCDAIRDDLSSQETRHFFARHTALGKHFGHLTVTRSDIVLACAKADVKKQQFRGM